MVGIGNQGLGMENVTTDELANSHGKIGDQANPGDPYTRIEGVGRGQVGIVVVVVMAVTMTMAAMTAMAPSLRGHERKSGSW